MLIKRAAAHLRNLAHDDVTRGWLVITVGSATRMGINFATGILVARGLGPEQYGIFSILGAIASISGVIVDFGLTSAGVRYIAVDWQQNKSRALQRAQTFFWLRLILATLVIAPVMMLTPLIADEFWPIANGSLLLTLAFLSMGTTLLSGSLNAILEATRYFGRIAIIIITNSTFSFFAVVLLIYNDLLTLEYVFIGSSLMGSLAGFILAFRLWPEPWRKTADGNPILGFPGIRILREMGPSLWHFGSWLWAGNILRVLAGYLDIFLINQWMTAGMVGLYALALNLASKVELINSSLHAALVPTVSTLPHQAAVRRYLRQSAGRSLLLVLPILGLIPLGAWFIPLFYGAAYQPAVPIFQLLLLTALIDLFTLGPILLIYTFQKPGLLAGGEFLQTVILIGGGAWLIPMWGPMGAVIARLFARIIRALFILTALIPLYRVFPTDIES